MKHSKIVTIAFLLGLFALSARAQFKQGTILVGGSVSGSSSSQKFKSSGTSTVTTEYKETDISFLPMGGYFVLDNFAVGLAAGLSRDVTKYTNSNIRETTSYATVGLFARYYYHNFFGQGAYQTGAGATTYINADEDDHHDTVHGGSLGVGYAWLITENLAVEPLIGFQSTTTKQRNYPDKQITTGLFLQIGFQIYLNR